MATVNLGRIKFVWQGAYSGATAYVADDVVSYNGSSYICILASTNNLPTNTTYWSQMSSAGTNGTNGTDVGTTITTQGDILYRDASGLARLGAGTNGQVLTTAGASANPSWTTISAGKLLQIQTATASTTVSDSSNLNGFRNSTVPANQGTAFITIAFTPTSASSKLVCYANAPVAVGGNNTAFGGIFHNGTCIGLGAVNGYASDGGTSTVFGFVNSTNTSARNIIFRNMGTMDGYASLFGGYRGSDTLQISSGIYGTLTVLEIQP
jgi:hypothetical protein